MTKDDIALVRASWHTVAPVKRVAAELFYVKLFELDPTLRLLFGHSARLRERKFLQLLGATVQGLDRVEVLGPAVRELGMRHPLFGDSDERQATVAAALTWTLEKCLRRDFTLELRTAWNKTYDVLLRSLDSADVRFNLQAVGP